MKKYLIFLKQKFYLGLLIIGCFALLGSVLGARKESKEPLPGITSEEQLIIQTTTEAHPALTGTLPLAASQNKWYNFKYAFVFSILGLLVFCCISALYLHFYNLKFFVMLRKEIEGSDLFIKF